jgi:DNA-binding NarL/FixJ family response regulator
VPGISSPDSGPPVLLGRHAERATIAALLTAARESRSGALVVRGEAGFGKTALLEHAVAAADGFTVLTARGVESETELAFAGLHRLLRPVMGRIAALPPPQADALASAFQLAPARPQDRFGVSLAVLSLLSDTAEDRPVLCCVDDLQWMDAPSVDALAFAARRLEAEGIAMLCAEREDGAGDPMPGVPVLPLTSLDAGSCDALLRARSARRVAHAVRAAMIRQTEGNPLALVELVGLLTGRQLSGADPLPEPLPLSAGLQHAYLGRVSRLPADTQRLLLIAAADEDMGTATLLRAAAVADIDVDAMSTAEAAGLVAVSDAGVRFRHPLVRSAVYQGATLRQRRDAHRVLATVFDDPESDRRAWHRAAAVLAPGDTLAGELEATAGRARVRGGSAAAAAALERAAELTSDDGTRARRLTRAAFDAWLAGRASHAVALLNRALPLAHTDEQLGEIEFLRGDIELHRGTVADAYEALLAAAARLAATNRALAVRALVGAGEASTYAGDLERFLEAGRRAVALRAGGERPETQLMLDLLAGTGAVFQGHGRAGASLLRRVLAHAERVADPDALARAGAAALMLGDDTRAHALPTRAVATARARGAVAAVPYALETLVHTELWTGRLASAHTNALEGLRLARETGQHNRACNQLANLALVAAARGNELECRAFTRQALAQATAHGLGLAVAQCGWALAFLDLSLGRAAEASARLRRLATAGPGSGHQGVTLLSVPHLVEAVVRAAGPDGHDGADGAVLESARSALQTYSWWADLAGNPAIVAIAVRCQALLSQGDEADGHFQEALRLHAAHTWEFEQARTEVLYGEALRRARRRSEARVHLRNALEVFERCGAAAWERRARAELRATGEKLSPRSPLGTAELTPQELQIGRFIAEGATNREVAAQLFLSPRTVDYHLRRIFTKLGISSRVELVRFFARDHGRLGGEA